MKAVTQAKPRNISRILLLSLVAQLLRAYLHVDLSVTVRRLSRAVGRANNVLILAGLS
jgi:hypothetical protein